MPEQSNSPDEASPELSTASNNPDKEQAIGTLHPSALDPVPDGGLQAWLVAAGGACIFFCCMGFSNAFGTFQEYYMKHQLQDQSADRIAWIGSLALFLQFAIGMIAGPMFDRYGAWMLRPASIFYVFAIMMTSICKEYWQFMLAQGLLTGICMGFLQVPSFAAISQHFEKKRAAALGLAISGSSIGGVVMPIALSKMLNGSSLGFGWSVRIVAFLMVPFMAFACVTVKARMPPNNTDFFTVEPFKNKGFLCLVAGMFFAFLGMFTPLFFLPTYAVMRGTEPTLASYLLAILNAASTFGRIIPGILADKYGRLNIFAFACFSSGIVIFCMNEVENTAGFIVYSIVVGFTTGTIISSVSASFTVLAEDMRKLGLYMGTGLALGSVACLIGPPLNGVFADRYQGFLEVCIFSGMMCLVGGCAALGTKALRPQGVFGRI